MLTTQELGTCTRVLIHVAVWSGSPQGLEEWLLTVDRGIHRAKQNDPHDPVYSGYGLGQLFWLECWLGSTLGLDFK